MAERISRSRCISADQKIDQIINVINNLEVEGATYDAGCGIDPTSLASNTIVVAVDGVSIICEDGVLKAIAASDLTAGCGIEIDGGEVSVRHDATLLCEDGVLSVAGGSQNVFTRIAVSGQPNVDADSPTDTLNITAAGYLVITTNATTDTVTFTVLGDGVGYDEIQEEGTPLTKRAKLNIIGPNVTATDDAANNRTNITITPETTSLCRGMAVTLISAATGFTPADRGSGDVQFYADDTGLADGDPVEVSNQFFDSFVDRSVLWCDRSKDPPEVISVGCTEVPE